MKDSLQYYLENIIIIGSLLTVLLVYSLTWTLFYAIRHDKVIALILQGILILMWWILSNFFNFFVFYTLVELPNRILLKTSVLLLFLLYPCEYLLFNSYPDSINTYTVYLALFGPFLIAIIAIYKVVKVRNNLQTRLEKRQGLYHSTFLALYFLLMNLFLTSGWRLQNEKLSIYLSFETVWYLEFIGVIIVLLLNVLLFPNTKLDINGVPILKGFVFQLSSDSDEDNHSPPKNDEVQTSQSNFDLG